jgi:hypothetical protein
VTTDQLLQAMTLIGQIAGPFAATVAAIASIVGAMRSQRNGNRLDSVNVNVDGRLSQLLETTKVAAHAQGVLAEKTRQESDKIDNSETSPLVSAAPVLPMPSTDLPHHPF